MTTIDRLTRPEDASATTSNGKTRPAPKFLHMRRLTIAFLLAVSPVAAACTPAEIEASVGRISTSFEEGGVERGLADAIFVAETAIPIIGMRLGAAFGP